MHLKSKIYKTLKMRYRFERSDTSGFGVKFQYNELLNPCYLPSFHHTRKMAIGGILGVAGRIYIRLLLTYNDKVFQTLSHF